MWPMGFVLAGPGSLPVGDLSKQIYRRFGVDPAKENNKRTVDDCLRELKSRSAGFNHDRPSESTSSETDSSGFPTFS